MMDSKQWFFEDTLPNSNNNFKIGIKIKEKLLHAQSPFQTIEVYTTEDFGNMLVLDGIVQTTEKDHFIYHEMMTHLPMLSHQNPKNVLIIGGGDGGMLNEVLKYPVGSATMVEIDEKVSEVSKQHLSSICQKAFDDSRATVLFKDGKAFIEQHKNVFDVIILDLSDPVGPAEQLITSEFYKNVKQALTPKGVIAIQSGSLTWQKQEVHMIAQRVSHVFDHVVIHKAVVPTYQGGEFSFTIASDMNLNSIPEHVISQRYQQYGLKTTYYKPALHHASAILPQTMSQVTKEKQHLWHAATSVARQIKHAPPTEPLGTHVIAEFWGTKNIIDDIATLEDVLIQAAKHANSTPLKVAVERFEPQGITGAIILAESHGTIHTWPERNYVAVDAFTCGSHTEPEKAIAYLQEAFQPERVYKQTILRGIEVDAQTTKRKETEKTV